MSDNNVTTDPALIDEAEIPETTTSNIVTYVVGATLGAAIGYGLYKVLEKRDARRAAKEQIHVVTDLEDQSTAS